jgi:hypothetical protein
MNSIALAAKHSLDFEGPAPGFFEGALMGNGALGVVVTTRPDAICLHLGHNNVWDIRIQEKNQDKIGSFDYVYNKLKSIDSGVNQFTDNPWYREYSQLTGANYNCRYPRPFPCGTIMLFFDNRKAEVLGYHLDISTGLLTITLLAEQQKCDVKIIVEPDQDVVKVKVSGTDRRELSGVFRRIRILPEESTVDNLPRYVLSDIDDSSLYYEQTMPFQIPEEREDNKPHPKDKKFSVKVSINQKLHKAADLSQAKLDTAQNLEMIIQVTEGLASDDKFKHQPAINDSFELSVERATRSWKDFWSKSAVKLEDEFLEKIWYRNNYFINCAISPNATCPGLFANWMHKDIGTAWHGDYHFNYNIQQPFWGVFSSNHPEKHLPYLSLIEHLLPVSKKWAKDYYGMSGAFFPHSAYPVEMNMMPYPVPTWGWEICETPWAVQSLWWHYTYTGDKELLSERIFQPIKESVSFLIDYMTREDAHNKHWGDDKYHVFPTVVPELYELTLGFAMNYDCIIDLTLIKFIFKAFLKACSELGVTETEKKLISDCNLILNNLASYPKVQTGDGEIYLTVTGENPEVIQNVPVSISPVFPGEDVGLDSPASEYEIAAETWRRHRNEGGNDLVFYNLQGARLGILDLEKFKRQIKYCMLPNGTCGDRLLLSGGRYSDDTDFDYMMGMGIWFENFSLPAVINDCLLHGFGDVKRVFPNWNLSISSEFRDLRTSGAFLVSAACQNNQITKVEVFSERGGMFQLHNPWKNGADVNGEIIRDEIIEIMTEPGERYVFVSLE